jgi:hypothetical protein
LIVRVSVGIATFGVSNEFAAVFLDTQCPTMLVHMGLGEDPELLRAQAWLPFAGLIGATDAGVGERIPT